MNGRINPLCKRLQIGCHRSEAQATTEYILILSVVVGLFLLVYKNLVVVGFGKMKAAVIQKFDQGFANPASLHRFPIKK